mgnify:CR=1 FL=1
MLICSLTENAWKTFTGDIAISGNNVKSFQNEYKKSSRNIKTRTPDQNMCVANWIGFESSQRFANFYYQFLVRVKRVAQRDV